MEEVKVELKDVVREAYELGLFNITSDDTYGKGEPERLHVHIKTEDCNESFDCFGSDGFRIKTKEEYIQIYGEDILIEKISTAIDNMLIKKETFGSDGKDVIRGMISFLDGKSTLSHITLLCKKVNM